MRLLSPVLPLPLLAPSHIAGTGLNVLSLYCRQSRGRTLSFVLAFSGGIMQLLCLDLLPEALRLGGVRVSLVGLLLGALLLLLDLYLPHSLFIH